MCKRKPRRSAHGLRRRWKRWTKREAIRDIASPPVTGGEAGRSALVGCCPRAGSAAVGDEILICPRGRVENQIIVRRAALIEAGNKTRKLLHVVEGKRG